MKKKKQMKEEDTCSVLVDEDQAHVRAGGVEYRFLGILREPLVDRRLSLVKPLVHAEDFWFSHNGLLNALPKIQ